MADFTNLCAALEAIKTGATHELSKLIGKFAALRRLADLQYLAGLGAPPLPNVASLLAPALLDIDKYNILAAMCPGLLPPFTPNALNQLQQTLLNGYQNLLNEVNGHPYSKLTGLQNKVDSAIGAAALAFSKRCGDAIMALECAQAICGAVSQVGTYPPTVMHQVENQYRRTIAQGGSSSQVLNGPQQAAANQAAATRAALTKLIAP